MEQESALGLSVKAMLDASADDRGTLHALARELDEAQADGKSFN